MDALAAVPSPDQQLGPDVHCLQTGLLPEPEQEGVRTLAGAGEDDAPGSTGAAKLLLQDLLQHLQFRVLRAVSGQEGQLFLVVCQQRPQTEAQDLGLEVAPRDKTARVPRGPEGGCSCLISPEQQQQEHA